MSILSSVEVVLLCRCWQSSLKMIGLNRWMRRREEWSILSTRELSSTCLMNAASSRLLGRSELRQLSCTFSAFLAFSRSKFPIVIHYVVWFQYKFSRTHVFASLFVSFNILNSILLLSRGFLLVSDQQKICWQKTIVLSRQYSEESINYMLSISTASVSMFLESTLIVACLYWDSCWTLSSK